MDDHDELRKSRFLMEQINNDEQPTEEEIFQKADSLEIEDLQLAKQALTKQLQPQWKPYMNRKGDIFYVNLQEKKAYIDHPIDMEILITYALKYKKKLPVFKEFEIDEISKSPRTVKEEISNYEREKGLNIVYEESEEESLRRDTLMSAEQPLEISQIPQLDYFQIQQYKKELQMQMNEEINQLKLRKESDFQILNKQSKEIIQKAKKIRLQQIKKITEEEIQIKNEIALQRSTQVHWQQLQAKRQKLEDLQYRQTKLFLSLQQSQKDRQQAIKAYYRERLLQEKQKFIREAQQIQISSLRRSLSQLTIRQMKIFEEKSFRQMSYRIDLKQSFLDRIGEIKDGSKLSEKRRYSIFNSEVFVTQKKQNPQQIIEAIYDKLKVKDKKLDFNHLHTKTIFFNKPSLSLRLTKKIL